MRTANGENFYMVFAGLAPAVISFKIKKSNPDLPAIIVVVQKVSDDIGYMILPYRNDGSEVPATDELAIVSENALDMRFVPATGERDVNRIDVIKIDRLEKVRRVNVFQLPDMVLLKVIHPNNVSVVTIALYHVKTYICIKRG